MENIIKIVNAGFKIDITQGLKGGYVITIFSLFGYNHDVKAKEFPECKNLNDGLDEVIKFIEQNDKESVK